MTLLRADNSFAARVQSLGSGSQSWATVQAGVGLGYLADVAQARTAPSGSTYRLAEGLIGFDLSALSGTVVGAQLYLTLGALSPAGADTLEFRVYDFGASPSASSFVPAANISSLPLFGSVDLAAFTADEPIPLTFSADGLAMIEAAAGGQLRLLVNLASAYGSAPAGSNDTSFFASVPFDPGNPPWVQLFVVYAAVDAVRVDPAAHTFGEMIQVVADTESDLFAATGTANITGPDDSQEQMGYQSLTTEFTAAQFFFEVPVVAAFDYLASCFEIWLGHFFDDFFDVGDVDAVQVYAFNYGTLTSGDWRSPTQLGALTLVAQLTAAEISERMQAANYGTYMLVPEVGTALTDALNGGVTKFLVVAKTYADAPSLSGNSYHLWNLSPAGSLDRVYLRAAIAATSVTVAGVAATAAAAARAGTVATVRTVAIQGVPAAAAAVALLGGVPKQGASHPPIPAPRAHLPRFSAPRVHAHRSGDV